MDLQENGTLGVIAINGSSPGLREDLDTKRIHLSLNTYSPCGARKMAVGFCTAPDSQP